jgi:hypothetical protein
VIKPPFLPPSSQLYVLRRVELYVVATLTNFINPSRFGHPHKYTSKQVSPLFHGFKSSPLQIPEIQYLQSPKKGSLYHTGSGMAIISTPASLLGIFRYTAVLPEIQVSIPSFTRFKLSPPSSVDSTLRGKQHVEVHSPLPSSLSGYSPKSAESAYFIYPHQYSSKQVSSLFLWLQA